MAAIGRLFGGGKTAPAPVPPPITPAPVSAPTPADPSVAFSGQNARAAGAAYGGTLATAGLGAGLTKPATTQRKSLLGD